MDLGSLLADYQGIRPAFAADNQAILDFFKQNNMQSGDLKIAYDRAPDFFRFLAMQAAQYQVLVAENQQGELTGVASYSLRQGFLGGEKQMVGYLGDLRLKFDRSLLRSWRRLYGDLLNPEYRLLGDAKYLLTAVLDENLAAMRALVANTRNAYRYDHLRSYAIVQVFGRWLRGPKSRYEVKVASEEDLPTIRQFLAAEHRHLPFGFDFAGDEWEQRLRSWPLAANDFLFIRDQGKIIAVTALWSPDAAKHILIESMPWWLHGLLQLQRRLMRGRPLPLAGERLRVRYLTHLCLARELVASDQAQAFLALFHAALDRARPGDHALAFADFANFRALLRGTVSYSLPASLYVVRHQSLPALAPGAGAVGFEMALV